MSMYFVCSLGAKLNIFFNFYHTLQNYFNNYQKNV